MKKIFLLFALLLFCTSPVYATKVVSFGALTGGVTGALDAIPCNDVNGDGTTTDALATGDRAMGDSGGKAYFYVYDATSTAAESSPEIIVPDNRADCGSAGAWIRSEPYGTASNVAIDLADDGTDEASALSEIATLNDTNNAFSVPATDKLLIDLSKPWPMASGDLLDIDNTGLADGNIWQYNGTSGNHEPTGSLSSLKIVLGDELSAGSVGTAGLTGFDTTAKILEVDEGTEVLPFTPTGYIDDAVEFVVNGGGSALTTGIQAGAIRVPWDCTITGAYLYLDQASTTTVDIWVDTHANYPPTDADSITATAPLSTSAALTASDTTLTGWTTSINAGSVIYYNVDANDVATWGTVVLEVLR